MEAKRTLVLGASDHQARYAYLAVGSLFEKGHIPLPVGIRPGKIHGIDILLGQPPLRDIHTVTVYLNPRNQAMHIDYVLRLKPKRIIFNPGAENPFFEQKSKAQNIEVVNACTLVMLSIGNF